MNTAAPALQYEFAPCTLLQARYAVDRLMRDAVACDVGSTALHRLMLAAVHDLDMLAALEAEEPQAAAAYSLKDSTLAIAVQALNHLLRATDAAQASPALRPPLLHALADLQRVQQQHRQALEAELSAVAQAILH